MRIVKVFNNNVVLAEREGSKVILTGRGLGFGARSGDLVDNSKVVETFTPNPGIMAQLNPALIGPLITAVETADIEPKPALVVALADHIHSALERVTLDQTVEYPLAAEVKHLYVEEYSQAQVVLDSVRGQLDVELDDTEVVALTLHLVNASMAAGDMTRTYTMTGLISQILEVVESHFSQPLSTDSATVARFVTHLRYLFARMRQDSQLTHEHSAVGEAIVQAYPVAAECAVKLSHLIELRLGHNLSDDEISYLTLHIARLESGK
ncbi:MAG: PRD domain-containing protein [Corynebacterium sp.]|nr:PRD domain-containing protein [Corynebacterium sp.]